MFALKRWILLASVFLSFFLLILSIKSALHLPGKAGMPSSKPKILNYVINHPRTEINLNLFEAERYEPAIIVQSLVGNLVYYSNHGRYEPRLAQSWRRQSPTLWSFKLRPNLAAENGEPITAATFKISLEKVLRFLSRKGSFPILMHLKGYDNFISGNGDLAGIRADKDILSFEFEEPLRDGLLQVLSFAPFGYIASGNLNDDGSWKDDNAFISSGPYRLDLPSDGAQFSIVKRSHWFDEFASGAPEQINFYFDAKKLATPQTCILDAFTNDIEPPKDLLRFSLIPEFINPILLGTDRGSYFANASIRSDFKRLLVWHRSKLPAQWGSHSRSSSFYPSQALTNNVQSVLKPSPFPKPKQPLTIEGEEPAGEGPRSVSWGILKKALSEANLPYIFSGNPAKMSHLSDSSYDIRLRGASTGGGAEAWGIKILFCSDLGPRFPDPSGRICKLLNSFDTDEVTDREFAESFLDAVEEDDAIIPISHYGVQLFLSPNIRQASLSPTLSIIRFDKMEID